MPQGFGAERRIRGTKIGVSVRATLVRQLERIQHILRRTWAERRRKAAAHRRPWPLPLPLARCRGGRRGSCRQQQLEGASASYREERRPTAAQHIITHVSVCEDML